MRTSLKQMLEIGGDAIVLTLVETAFLTGLVIAGLELSRGDRGDHGELATGDRRSSSSGNGAEIRN
jgi:hypothetical protein